MLFLLFFGVLFVLLFVITTFKPGVGLVGSTCIYGLEQWAQTQNTMFVRYSTMINFAMGIVILYSLMVMILHNRNPFKNFPPVGWLVWTLFAWAYMSYFWSIAPEQFAHRPAALLPYVLTYVFLTPLIIQHPKDLRDGLMATILLGAIILLGITLSGSYKSRALVIDNYRGSGNPLALGTLGGTVAIVTAMFRFVGLTRIMQILRWGVVGVAMYVLLRSQSRGQFFALLAAMFMFLPFARQLNLRSVRAVSAIFSMAVFAILTGVSFYMVAIKLNPERWSMEKMSGAVVEGRLHNVMMLLERWIDSGPIHWVLGLGASIFITISPNGIGYPHNVPGEVLGELGLVGFSMLMGIYYLTLRAIIDLMRWTKDYPLERSVFAALSALFTFEMILSWKQGSFLGGSPFMLFAICLGRMHLALRPYMQQVPNITYYTPPEYDSRAHTLGAS